MKLVRSKPGDNGVAGKAMGKADYWEEGMRF